METEDLTGLPASRNSDYKSEIDEVLDLICEPCDTDSLPINSEVIEDRLNGNTSVSAHVEVGKGDTQLVLATEVDTVKLSETIADAEDLKRSSLQTENGCLTVADRNPMGNRKRDGDNEMYGSSISGVKKARITVDEPKPSVHVMYSSLTRQSKQKLEELLQQWSEWHSQHCFPSQDSIEVLESGEETYFPALRVGVDNPSSVTFWMDNQTRNQHSREFPALDSKTVPLYDRGYSLEGDMAKLDASRCFNCGSYSHSLKECPKPRNYVAVNNARKEHQSKRGQNSSFRIPTRYYQNSPRGKYDGLTPGALHAETRQLLGLGELDPPPWLNRMRDIGYPPGYLDPEDDDQPSGISIFSDEESKEEKENGKILETDHPWSRRKMSVQFPGVNALIPENADIGKWAGPSSLDLSSNHSDPRSNFFSQPNSRPLHHEQRWFGDEGPPGCDPGFSPVPFSFSQRYGSYDYGSTSRSAISSYPMQGSPIFGRSLSDGGVRGPLFYDGSPLLRPHFQPYSLQQGLFSPPNYGSAIYKRWC